ncbi:hypothetical protein TVAG_260230 [Trichomonas vaginalis G3]|uniref:Uncharacterized protein n=1 Tax=Trichomonas vaginalis (strain ATCC PRA-98 / G3) TaxID=412133 RepID=A2E8V5_TRIV3|nr:zebrafish dkey-57n24.6 family [Trichomonas vaginalis G3]EAY10937.1 hypothetical protein TVAG_260230 [Trichomonas vaginalis G3]KAI5485524.1 zebrafish dkey-57n24.6 family [Trichomonas vaginalis G3]|eukprot:XP_001323160.1 hypothetical protein [Trichomonas vaginalis G3]
MKGKKNVKGAQQPDVPVVLDCCGVDVNDPNGNHTVNFTFTVEAEEDPSKPFEGDLDFQFPHQLGKAVKPPKIETGHPTTKWVTTMPVNIDDAFINQIREKRLLYKIVFLYKSAAHGKPPPKGAAAGKKGNDKSQTHVTNHTFFIDATCLLVRGGRFKPFLTYTASCVPPSFTSFKITISIDHPLLSDAQIRRHQPTVCFIKGVHQLPNSPLSYEELAASCLGPFIVLKTATPQYTCCTMPGTHASDIKMNIAVMFWQTPSTDVSIELHDRDIESPEISAIVGSSFVVPDQTAKQPKQEALSFDQILGVKKEQNTIRPYAELTFPLKTGRFMIPFTPVQTSNTVIMPGAYTTSGTYMSIEVESMKETVPQMAVQQVTTPPSKAKAQEKPHNAKDDKNQQKVTFNTRRVVIIAHGNLIQKEKLFMDGLQMNIVRINAEAFKQKDIATVSSMKLEKEDVPAISGFIMMTGEFEVTILEMIENTDASTQIHNYLKYPPGGNIDVLCDENQVYKSPRLYGTLDCAVKKFKLATTLGQLLLDPQLYVHNSHLANCFKVCNTLKRIESAKSLAEFDTENLWPLQADIEMLNAKCGMLLSLDELSFPPRDPEAESAKSKELIRMKSMEKLTVEEEAPLNYVPLKKETVEVKDHTLEYYQQKNMETIRMLEEKNRVQKAIISGVDDDDTLIVKDGKTEIPPNFYPDKPEPYVSLAATTSGPALAKMFRQEDGTEIRDGVKFNNYANTKTYLQDPISLKVDVNHDPWDKGDKPLCTGAERLFADVRGPLYDQYNPVCKPGGYFSQQKSIFIDEEYNDKKSNKPEYITKGINHSQKFNAVVAPAGKNEEILGRTVAPGTLNIQEPWQPQDSNVKNNDLANKPRFNTMFKAPIKKGTTDSAYVAKLVPTFPTPKPGF